MRGHSGDGYGSVATNKIIATIIADLFGLQVQAYPMYGSEKKGLPTTYYLTVAALERKFGHSSPFSLLRLFGVHFLTCEKI